MVLLFRTAILQCPWHQDVPDLQSSCLCAHNLGRELSVQCDQVSKFITFTFYPFLRPDDLTIFFYILSFQPVTIGRLSYFSGCFRQTHKNNTPRSTLYQQLNSQEAGKQNFPKPAASQYTVEQL